MYPRTSQLSMGCALGVPFRKAVRDELALTPPGPDLETHDSAAVALHPSVTTTEAQLQYERDRSIRLMHKLREARRSIGAGDHAIATIAHELRTPLTSLRLLTEDLLERDDDVLPRQSCGDIAKLHQIMLGMASTLDSVLDAVRLEHATLDWRRVDLQQCCREAINLVARQVSPQTHLAFFCDSPTPHLMGDAESLRRLAVNLIANACHHTSAGRITVTINSNSRGWLQLNVFDTGSGIDKAMLSNLGQPFARGHHRPGGSGLGLWICRSIAAAHGGHLLLSSAPGIGTRTTVRLRTDLQGPNSHDAPPSIVILPYLVDRAA